MQASLVQFCWGNRSFLRGPGAYKVLSVPSKSLFPILRKFCNHILLTFKVRLPRDTQSLHQIPRLGSLLWGLEILQQYDNFFGITVLQHVHCPSGGSVLGLMDTSSKKTFATCCACQDCCCLLPASLSLQTRPS